MRFSALALYIPRLGTSQNSKTSPKKEVQMSEKCQPKRKKLKVEKKPNPSLFYCGYVSPKDQKKCPLMRKKINKYCAEHMVHDPQLSADRIPCPLDPNHTVWKRDLKSHLLKCNARAQEPQDAWFELDYNCTLHNSSTSFTLEDDPALDVKECIKLVESVQFEPLSFRICQHRGLAPHLQQRTFQKHVLQQASLIGNLERLKLLAPEFFYMEYGCGKGELSRYVNQCILADAQDCNSESYKGHSHGHHGYGYGLIDRGTNRMKSDSKIIEDSESSPTDIRPRIKRSKIDIKDLNLDSFLGDVQQPQHQIVTISKHLCGSATDLTLKSVLNSSIFHHSFGGILIAMCCRHVCSLDQLLPESRKYLHDLGFTSQQSFSVLKKMVSWANDASKNEEISEREHSSGLEAAQRLELGLRARRIIDESRAHAMRTALGANYDVEIFWYIESEITLENVCLSIVEKSKRNS
ncbi:uncharacterized protein LODBEIA_P08570 [Lodderomyces beijingensis]|uniref:tRNA:m(4)X modification enzyme TRM13 n=1 Tax=Lodderomyces beijingensis TaxID=1775926 RepID=A0ABP0ZGC3_9ASCO